MSTILVVDDVATHRAFLRTVLTAYGHRVVEAADGKQGLAATEAESPNLIITDVLMPVMDGYEFVRQLRLNPSTRDIPVVFYTASFVAREVAALTGDAGVSRVMTKPAHPEELVRVVERLLAGESRGVADSLESVRAPRSDYLRLLSDRASGTASELRVANAHLRALINIGLELASDLVSGRMLQNVCDAACDLFGSSYVTLGVLDVNTGTVLSSVHCGTDDTGWIKVGDVPPGILGEVIRERRTMRGENREGTPAGLRLPEVHPVVRAYLVAPITSPDHTYGWICLVGNEGKGFTEDDEELVRALASQVGRIYELDHEIVERRQAETSLRKERDRSQRFLDTAAVFLLALDTQGRITLVNRFACEVLGWTPEELLGRDFIETCIPARLREGTRTRFNEVVAGDLALVLKPVVTKSGAERLIEWHNTILRDDTGTVVGTFSSGTDLTERNQALEALGTAEERMRFALEAAHVGIWDMNYVTGDHVWSPELEAQYGLPPGSFGKTFEAFTALIHPDDRAGVLDTIGKAMQSGSDFAVVHRTLRPDGTVRWLSGSGRVQLGKDGQPTRATGISQDVTERRSLEEQYQQAQKMEAIGRLAGGVAHDFNNLLTVILGHSELLLSDLKPDDPSHEDVAAIHKAGLSAAGLTRQLLAFSRKQIIEPALLNLNVVVGEMRGMLGRLIGEDIKIVLRLCPTPALVMADRGQIEQVVMNLAVNARDAMLGGGTLMIETSEVQLDENYPNSHFDVKPGPYIVLTITDTGTGMTREVQARLFEPFFTTKELGRGTGLGLATVHGIIARSGGSINVYSEVGRGTSFKVYFPRISTGDAVVEAPALVPRSPGMARTVLVVEDAEGLRELTGKLLVRDGYRVLLAGSAEEALRLFNEHLDIDVLLTDVVMPGASGPELTRKLMEQRPNLKVIFMSGYTEDAIVHHQVVKPGIAFLHKPFTSETLGRKLNEVLAQRSAP